MSIRKLDNCFLYDFNRQRGPLLAMASPSMVHKSGDTLIVRSVVSGDRLYESDDQQSSPPTHSPPPPPSHYEDADADLPQCRVRRNYECGDCNYFTQNPRHFLSHLRDVHGEKVKIYDCPQCLYASKHFQKLLRHMRMVHGVNKNGEAIVPKPSSQPAKEPLEIAARGRNEKNIVGDFKCSACDFATNSHNLLMRHERREHQKAKLFPCTKCHYVTHIKARFTKHVKYHSMPMIKCDVCDFHTPYKWNLDRHMKNHGGTGAFCCSACNFTADIKQSLTVHEMNHHIPAVGTGVDVSADGTDSAAAVRKRLFARRRRNRVGGSDSIPIQTQTKNRTRSHPRTRIRTTRPSLESDATVAEIHQDDLAEISLATVTIVNNDDKFSTGEKRKHVSAEENNLAIDESANGEPPAKLPKKTPRPVPNLIPLQGTGLALPRNINMFTGGSVNSLNSVSATVLSIDDKIDAISYEDSTDHSQSECTSVKGNDESSQQSVPTMARYVLKKKNASIFDKLYEEKLKTVSEDSAHLICKECGNVSKSMSEHNVHEKICNSIEAKFNTAQPIFPSGLGSTRCQHCRHRCKSSLDLVMHMQTCPLISKERQSHTLDNSEIPTQPPSEGEASTDDPQGPHPMENVVFVWNSMLQKPPDSYDDSVVEAMSHCSSENLEGNHSANRVITSTPNYHAEVTKDKEQNDPNAKKVFKCPHCSFWASTASRFHVHIVGHLNKKPFECSLCSYKSNWRWDITKHIRLKSVRDPDHAKAKVLMTDETGRRNYSKYNKFLTIMQISDSSADVGASGNRKSREMIRVPDIFYSDVQSSASAENIKVDSHADMNSQSKSNFSDEKVTNKRTKKTTWKCKKCDYRNTSKEALLAHIRKHSKLVTTCNNQEDEDIADVPAETDASSVTYRCGHCNQVSNWKHVIQRHCRLKHHGDIKVEIEARKFYENAEYTSESPTLLLYNMKCSKCPFITNSKGDYEDHLRQHVITPESTIKCFICPYYVKTQSELLNHLMLHGISEPEKYSTQKVNVKSTAVETVTFKRYKCSECPYESNSKSQFTYHEQFHKESDAPFKCELCSYQVSKRHLLHQHLKVHGFVWSQNTDAENTNSDLVITPVPKAPSGKNISPLRLMWAFHNSEYQKMYQCRFCPYVNKTKNDILEHEKNHNDISAAQKSHRCADCNFTSDNINLFVSHDRVHKKDYVTILCKVSNSKKDEEQIKDLKRISSETSVLNYELNPKFNYFNSNESESKKQTRNENKKINKYLYFCSDCPARFFLEKELQIHFKFHYVDLPYKCETCTYRSRQHSHLLAHKTVHTKEYQDMTKYLRDMHATHPVYPQPKIIESQNYELESVWIAATDSTKRFDKTTSGTDVSLSENGHRSRTPAKQHMCNQCPARFFKSATLNYHLTLHGGSGNYKCRHCNYAVKTLGNLAKHEAIHGTIDMPNHYESGDDSSLKNVPISGTDLYQHKAKAEKLALEEKLVTRPNDHFPPVLQADPQFGLLIHGNPDFIYPTCLKNGKTKEKRYKCHKCPSAFEKREQYKVHLSLHGSKQRYKCELCDYSVKYYANYVQHMRKHQMNADARAAQKSTPDENIIDLRAAKNDTKFAIKSLPRQSHKDCTKLSISDQQTLKLLHKKGANAAAAASAKDATDDRKIYRCTHCPYTNQRRDALDNHMRRHTSMSGITSNFTCPYCDYAAPQTQYLRDHVKLHFQQQKHAVPEFFANFRGIEVFISKVAEDDDAASLCADDGEHLFVMNENLKISNLTPSDSSAKIYVVPNSGERIIIENES